MEDFYQDRGPLSSYSADELEEIFGKSDFFVYHLDFQGVAPGATATSSFTVQTDASFLWQEANYMADIADAAFTINTQPVPNMSVLITDTGSGRQLMNVPVPVPNIYGLGRESKVLRCPRWFAKMAQVQVAVTNYDAEVTYNLHLSFIGTKFFGYQPTA